jgi:CCR4-NOT transcriptional regulation complex NOT5 subunit
MLKDFVIGNDMISPEFKYLDLESPLKPKGFMDMFKSSFNNRPVESDLNPTPLKKEGWSTNMHSILPTYRMVDESAISEMELDTLFFIFYYQKVSPLVPTAIPDL